MSNASGCALKTQSCVPKLRLPIDALTSTKEPEAVDHARLSTGAPVAHSSPTDAKVALFHDLFHGREEIYPVRWEGKSGKSGYAPACANEWRPGICEKPRVKCVECGVHAGEMIMNHLVGHWEKLPMMASASIPLLKDETCRFLAVDFDGDDWRIKLDISDERVVGAALDTTLLAN